MEIFIVFSKTTTLFSRALSKAANFKYMHTSISFVRDLSIMYSFGRLQPRNPLNGGFVQESIYDGVYQFSNDVEIKVFKMLVAEDQKQQLLDAIHAFEAEASRYRYNLLGLILIPFRIRFVRKHHYFCSQFVSQLLVTTAILDQSIAPEWTSPEDLIRYLDLELVYEGKIDAYPYLKAYTNKGLAYDDEAFIDG